MNFKECAKKLKSDIPAICDHMVSCDFWDGKNIYLRYGGISYGLSKVILDGIAMAVYLAVSDKIALFDE